MGWWPGENLQVSGGNVFVGPNSPQGNIVEYLGLFGNGFTINSTANSDTSYVALPFELQNWTRVEKVWGRVAINTTTSTTTTYQFGIYDEGIWNAVTGTATAGASATLTDSTKSWTTNAFTTASVRITSGTGAGQTRYIASNTATQLTVTVAWTTNPDNTSVYAIEYWTSTLQCATSSALTPASFGNGSTIGGSTPFVTDAARSITASTLLAPGVYFFTQQISNAGGTTSPTIGTGAISVPGVTTVGKNRVMGVREAVFNAAPNNTGTVPTAMPTTIVWRAPGNTSSTWNPVSNFMIVGTAVT